MMITEMYKAFLLCTTNMIPDPETGRFVFSRKPISLAVIADEDDLLTETFLPQSKSRSMDMMAQIMATAIEKNYDFHAKRLIISTHDDRGGYLIVFLTSYGGENEEVDEFTDPELYFAASAFLSDLKGVNLTPAIEIDSDQLCISVARQIDLFNLLEDYVSDTEHLLPGLDNIVTRPYAELNNISQQFYRESMYMNAAKARGECADKEEADRLLMLVTPKPYLNRTHYESSLIDANIPSLPFSMDHLAKIIEQEEGTKPRIARSRTLVFGGYQ